MFFSEDMEGVPNRVVDIDYTNLVFIKHYLYPPIVSGTDK